MATQDEINKHNNQKLRAMGADQPMRQYIAKGTVELSGATFYVTAENETEARRLLASNEWDDIQYAQAELVNWEPDLETLKEDK